MTALLIILAIVTFPIWWPLLLIVWMTGVAAVWWLLGMKITVKYADVPVGYVRWFKYYPTGVNNGISIDYAPWKR